MKRNLGITTDAWFDTLTRMLLLTTAHGWTRIGAEGCRYEGNNCHPNLVIPEIFCRESQELTTKGFIVNIHREGNTCHPVKTNCHPEALEGRPIPIKTNLRITTDKHRCTRI